MEIRRTVHNKWSSKVKGGILIKTLLYIKANPKPDNQSHTFRMSEAFVKSYSEANPEDNIVTLNLYTERIQFLDGQHLNEMFTTGSAILTRFATQFAQADRYVIAAPMWNLGSPAILKAYFDYVVLSGITFKYTEQGPVGLLAGKGKKCAHIVARGGLYNQPPMSQYEMGDRYIRTIMSFMGVEDILTVSTELTGVLVGQELEASVQASVAKAAQLGKSF